MPTLTDLEQLSEVDGVAHYILVRRDSHVMLHNLDDPATYASTIVMTGVNMEKIQALSITGRCQFYQFILSSGQNLSIFPLGNYFLGIFHTSGTENQTVIDNVSELLNKIITQGKNHSGIPA